MRNNKIKKVILIIADTLQAKYVTSNNNSTLTPNINRLCKSGIFINNAYATVTKTDPSVTSIFTGNYPLSTGLIHHGREVTPEEEENVSNTTFLQEILKKYGFYTAAIDWMGRWHKRGFDYYSGKLTDNINPTSFALEKLPPLFYLKYVDKVSLKFLKRDFFTRYYYSFFTSPKIPYDPSDKVIDKSIEILKKNNKKNLYLYIHLWDAHYPYTRSKGLRSFLFDSMEKMYLQEIKFLDRQIGRLLNHLEGSKQIKDTLIVFTADHGENFCDYDRPINHENLYDDVVKVPLIFSNPSINPQTIDALVQHVDVLPTILDLLKISPKKNIDGKSLLPLLKNSKNKIRDFAYFEDILYRTVKLTSIQRKRGIRIGNFKYIEHLKKESDRVQNLTAFEDSQIEKQELFNFKTDPLEKKDLSTINPKITGELKLVLDKVILLSNQKRLQNNPPLQNKVEESINIIRKAIEKFGTKDIAIAWKGGKDTTAMLHLIKTHYGKIPFKVFFNDTTLEFKETYSFIEKMKKLWKLDLVIIKHDDEELYEYHNTYDHDRKKELSRMMKITAINKALKKYKFKGFMLGIRRDENPARQNEKYFSKRKDHIRIHPLLDWSEEDVWDYTKTFGVPYSPLYDKGYRSVGEKPFTSKSVSDRNERSGRDQEKEQLMSRLRKMGYW